MNIYQRIAKVQKAVSKVAKDTTVSTGGQSYKAVSHDAVLSVIREAVIEAGIIISPSQIGKGEVIPGETKSGNYKHRFEAVYKIEFINIENPDDRHVVEVEAHADDNGDKAPGKAISYATKTAELKVFLIATGENDEERMEDGHYRQPPKQEAAKLVSDARQSINNNIKTALQILYDDNKTAMHDKLVELTTWEKDGKTIKGKANFETYSDKQAAIVLKELNRLVDQVEDGQDNIPY
jgi:ERF superfamily